MASVDDLFRRPPVSGLKRKLENPQDPTEIYKSAKINVNGNAHRNDQKSADTNEEAEAGPELPPDSDEEDDEEGRFFGGGVSQDTRTVLDFVNEQEDIKAEAIDSAWLKKTALNFEKKISKNAELRAKYENDPQKFINSEGDLDSSIKALSILSGNPELYPEFAKLGCVGSLVSLLSHENTDIAIDAIEIIGELIDQDVEAEAEQWDALVKALLEADLIDLLHANISRLNEREETDRTGVYHILEVIESLGSNADIAERLGKHDSVIAWLLERSTRTESKTSQNKQYAAEVLSILLQTSKSCREHFTRIDGVDLFLQALSAYRKRDPEKDTEEEEYVENLFDSLACILDEAPGKAKFLEAEGIELCLIMVKEGRMSRPRALRLLDHTVSGSSGSSSSEQIVEAAGLKPLFTLFMKSTSSQITEHLLSIFASMLRLLPGESAARVRLLGKFMERDYEKVSRLLSLRRSYTTRIAVVEQEITSERQRYSGPELDELSATWLSRRLDAGLFSLQTIDTILAWLVAEDDGAKATITDKLAERDETLDLVRQTLRAQLADLGDAAPGESDDDEQVSRDILVTLISFLA